MLNKIFLITLCLFVIFPKTSPGMNFYKDESSAQFCNGPTCPVIIIGEGVIDEFSVERFLDVWREFGGPNTIVELNSPGGNLLGGLALGRAFNTETVSVSVREFCQSACAYAFLGGRTRDAAEGSLAFHQFSIAGVEANEQIFSMRDISQSQNITGMIVDYLIEINADLRIYGLAASTQDDEFFRPTEEEMATLSITTFSDHATRRWQMLPFGDGLVAEVSGLSEPQTRARFWCAGGNVYFANFIDDQPSWSDQTIFSDMVSQFESEPPILRYHSPSDSELMGVAGYFHELNRIPEQGEIAVLFNLSADFAYFYANNDMGLFSEYPCRACAFFYQNLGLAPVDGDRRPLSLALRNCIN